MSMSLRVKISKINDNNIAKILSEMITTKYRIVLQIGGMRMPIRQIHQ